MPIIKLVQITGEAHYDYCDCLNYKNLEFEALSDWQEVSEEELDFLKSYDAERYFRDKKISMVIFEDVTGNFQEYVDDIKDFVKTLKEKQLAQKKKQEELTAKRKLTAEKKKIEKAKKVLAESGIQINDL
ncbi:MAG: hypothetical protein WCG45_01630 [bacterium]